MKTYDANGFDDDWIHIVTGTRYDEYGFNKDGSIHEVTRMSVDNKGHRRDYYIATDSEYIISEERIADLFFKYDNLDFIKKINKDLAKQNELPSKIRLEHFKIESKNIYHGPTCLDGSPDMRYSGGYTTSSTTHIKLKIIYNNSNEKLQFNYILDKKNSEDIIRKAIDSYNEYLYFMRDERFHELYKRLNRISMDCGNHKEKQSSLVSVKKEKMDIYNKLEQHKNNFNPEQLEKFNNLKQIIHALEKEINDANLFEKQFEEVYKKIKFRKNELKIKFDNNKINDEINSLFDNL